MDIKKKNSLAHLSLYIELVEKYYGESTDVLFVIYTEYSSDVADKLKEGTLKGGTIDINFNTRGAFENIQVKYQTSDGEKILTSNFSASDTPQQFSQQINVSDLTSNSIEVTVVGNNRIGTGDITVPNSYDLNIQVKGNVTGELKQTRIHYPIIQTSY